MILFESEWPLESFPLVRADKYSSRRSSDSRAVSVRIKRISRKNRTPPVNLTNLKVLVVCTNNLIQICTFCQGLTIRLKLGTIRLPNASFGGKVLLQGLVAISPKRWGRQKQVPSKQERSCAGTRGPVFCVKLSGEPGKAATSDTAGSWMRNPIAGLALHPHGCINGCGGGGLYPKRFLSPTKS